jgi:RimJ/RimL family protein N-acetyltransferase
MLYQIHRYPADLIDVIRFADGTRVVIRPVLPQDQDLTGMFFNSLSAPSRYDRFMSPVRQVSPELLQRFTNVDYADHLALVAEVFVDGRETVIAEARYVRDKDATTAEFAVSVAEGWQGRGLASTMLSKLICRASAEGVQRMVGETLATNERMLHLARKAGFTTRSSKEVRGVVLLERMIEPAAVARPCNDQGEAEARAAA